MRTLQSRLRLKLAAIQQLAAVTALAAIQQLVQVSAVARTVAATSNPYSL